MTSSDPKKTIADVQAKMAKAGKSPVQVQKTEEKPVGVCTPNTVPVIPADWAALGAKAGYNPKTADRLRLWIVGPSGEGKSTFLSSIPRNLILDFDDGADAIPGGRATRIYIRNYEHYMQVTDKLLSDAKAGKRHWDRVTVDTVDEWVGMISLQLEEEKGVECITEYGQQGSGYSLIKNRCWGRVMELEQAGYAWACCGHITQKTERNPVTKQESTVLRDAVYPSMSKKITTKAEFKLTIYCLSETQDIMGKKKLPGGKIIEVPTGSKTVQTYFVDALSTAEKENKSRGVPTMERKFSIPLIGGWDVFVEKYNKAVEEAKKMYA